MVLDMRFCTPSTYLFIESTAYIYILAESAFLMVMSVQRFNHIRKRGLFVSCPTYIVIVNIYLADIVSVFR